MTASADVLVAEVVGVVEVVVVSEGERKELKNDLDKRFKQLLLEVDLDEDIYCEIY